MMKIYTQAEIIKNVLIKSGEPLPSWALQKVQTEWGWLGTSADRTARKMAEAGEIERKRVGKYVYYWYLEKNTDGQLRFF
jgi:hypothetical protein|tara:strand:- start:1114 stop:1353 length:240 start_codon:yes stop_codon:yes gene_type:complete